MTNGRSHDGTAERHWRWTLASGLFTLLLAVVAVFLPDFEWAPTGGLVGWLLLLAGLAELAFAAGRHSGLAGQASLGSGILTAISGALFVFSPFAGYFPVANLVTAWLIVRGLWMVASAMRAGASTTRIWLAATGAADIVLGLVLIVGLPVAALVVSLFGPTREIVAQFAWILAASFAVTGLAQIGIALAGRRQPRGIDG